MTDQPQSAVTNPIETAPKSGPVPILSPGFKFVVDGYCRARTAAELRVRTQVEAEYSGQLAAAGFWERVRLWRQIEREAQRRLDRLAPPDALY
jgi:hypothetical protein